MKRFLKNIGKLDCKKYPQKMVGDLKDIIRPEKYYDDE